MEYEFELFDVIARFGLTRKWVVDVRSVEGYHVRPIGNDGELGIFLDFYTLDECHANFIKVGAWNRKERVEVEDE